MSKKFYINGAKHAKIQKVLDRLQPLFGNGNRTLITMKMSPKKGQKEHYWSYVKLLSLQGIHIIMKEDGVIEVTLPTMASDEDTRLCYWFLQEIALQRKKATITSGHTDKEADLSDKACMKEIARQHVAIQRLFKEGRESLMVRSVNGIDQCIHPAQFAQFNHELPIDELVAKFQHDLLEGAWRDEALEADWTDHEEHQTFILKWNPAISSFGMDAYADACRNFPEGFGTDWSIWDHEQVQTGDIFYMLRVGEGNTGIVWKGVIVSEPYTNKDWSGKNRLVWYAQIEVNEMNKPDGEPFITTKELAAAIPDFDWTGGHSGILMTPAQAATLDKLYRQKVHGPVDSASHSDRVRNIEVQSDALMHADLLGLTPVQALCLAVYGKVFNGGINLQDALALYDLTEEEYNANIVEALEA